MRGWSPRVVQEWCCGLFEAVLVVTGSHEYYCHGSVVTKQAVDQALEAMCSAHSNLHLMHPDQGPMDINGVLVGGWVGGLLGWG